MSAAILYNVPKKAYMHIFWDSRFFLRIERKRNNRIYTFFCLYAFETVFPCVSLDVLEFALWTSLAFNSQISSYLCVLKSGIKGRAQP